MGEDVRRQIQASKEKIHKAKNAGVAPESPPGAKVRASPRGRRLAALRAKKRRRGD